MRDSQKHLVKLKKYGNYPIKSFYHPSQMDFKDPNFIIMRKKFFDDKQTINQNYSIKKSPKQDEMKQ